MTHDPERATLSITISSQGQFQQNVSLEVVSVRNELHQSFTELAPKTSTGKATPEAAVTTFSMNSLRTWSYESFDTKGESQQ